MCVAAIIYEPLKLADLKAMDHDNPHGGGVAWLATGDNEVSFSRGLDAHQIHAMQEAGILTYPYLLHFRWATQGDIVPELTHPFPVGPRALFGELSGRAPEVLIHNGTTSPSTQKKWLRALKGQDLPEAAVYAVSDTAIAAWLIHEVPGVLEDIIWATAHAKVTNGALDIDLRGTFTAHEGSLYSNLNWLPAVWHKTATGTNARAWSWHESDGDITWYPPDPLDLCEKHLLPECISCRVNDEERQKAITGDDLTWMEYLRRKYGDAVAEEVRESEIHDLGLKITPFGMDALPDDTEDCEDLVSDDPEAVNAWLARRMIG